MIIDLLIANKEIQIHLDISGAPDEFLIDGELVDMRGDNANQDFLIEHDDKICQAITDEWLWHTRKRERVG